MIPKQERADFRHLSHVGTELEQPKLAGELSPVVVACKDGSLSLLDTYGVDARGDTPGPTIIYCQPWSDMCASEFNQRRMEVMAHATGAKIIGVDNPGIGQHTLELTAEMSGLLRQGDFSEIADMVWQAATKHPLFDLETTDELIVGMNSLGASMAAELAAHAPDGVHIDRLVSYETVAFGTQTPAELMHTYIKHGADGRMSYLAENPEWTGAPLAPMKLARYIGRSATAFLSYPIAMARRSFADAILDARDRESIDQHTLLQISNGSHSEVSSIGANSGLRMELQRRRLQVLQTVYMGETHPMFDSLNKTNRFWQDTIDRQA